ncbi:MAG: hypothetical protein QOC56_656 [Alphaproteobacteria bacterium]|nr:hypothetical protein [Alphaproteobacteria bacterium]
MTFVGKFVLLAGLIAFAAPCPAETIRVGAISEGATNWPMRVADEKGFYRQQGIEVQVSIEVDSQKLVGSVADGTNDISYQAADHFVRAVNDGKDVVIFMTVARPIFDFVTDPSIRAITDLKGATVAIDRPTTGYWLLFRKVFARNGLAPEDYKLLPNLGGAEKRFQAVQQGRAQGTFLNPPLSLNAIAAGFPRLTGLAEHFRDLPGTAGGVRGAWARAHEAGLVAYIRANMRAIDWLLDPNNREEALAIGGKRMKADRRELEGSYDSFVHDGLVRSTSLGMEGIRQVLDLLVESGQLSAERARPELYADPSYQQAAAALAR